MPHVFGKKKYLTFFDRNFDRRLPCRLHQTQRDVPLELIKKLFSGIVMIIASLVGTADHSDHHFTILPHLGIPHWRFEHLFILFNPLLKIKRFQLLDRRHVRSYSGLYASARISISRCGCGNWRTATVVRAGPSWPKYSP